MAEPKPPLLGEDILDAGERAAPMRAKV